MNDHGERERANDPVIDAFRADVDVTLLEENLKLTVEERFLRLVELQRFAKEIRDAGKRATSR